MNLKPFSEPIYHTKPILPDLKVYTEYLKEIWNDQWLTNNGVQHQNLEAELRKYLKVPNLSLYCNGTIALLCALKILNIKGKVITTPFTFPATINAIEWMGLEAVFCDIRADDLTLDPDCLEILMQKLGDEVGAVLPVHVFGNPCRVDQISRIANSYNSKIVYDGAHAFGLELNGAGIGTFGDAAMFSFHATKLFHTAEGGALSFNDEHLYEMSRQAKNFGIKSEGVLTGIGINGKMNELQAAMGLSVLSIVEKEMNARISVIDTYKKCLSSIPGIRFVSSENNTMITKKSYQYCAIEINVDRFGISRNQVMEKLKEYNVFARRYFYPLCNSTPGLENRINAMKGRLPIAEKAVEEVLALPLYGDLGLDSVERISQMIKAMHK